MRFLCLTIIEITDNICNTRDSQNVALQCNVVPNRNRKKGGNKVQACRGEIKYRLRQNWLLKQMARGYYDCSIAHHSNLTNGRPFKHSTKYLLIKSTLYILQFQLFRLNKINS